MLILKEQKTRWFSINISSDNVCVKTYRTVESIDKTYTSARGSRTGKYTYHTTVDTDEAVPDLTIQERKKVG